MTAAGPARRALGRLLALAVAVALGAGGCAIFPQGSYWPDMPSPGPAGALTAQARLRAEDRASADPRAAAARRDRLREAVGRRWSDEALAESARRMRGWAGRAAYADVLQVIAWCYVDKVTYGELVAAGLESLRAALDHPAFRERFPEAADEGRRAAYADALDTLRLKALAADPWLAFQAADWLAVAQEKNRAMLGLPDGAVTAEFLFGALDRLDPYTRYLTPPMLRDHQEQVEGEYTGIGAEVVRRDGRYFLARVFEGGAAAKAGLRPGDEVAAVGGESLADLAPVEVGRRLRGKEGTAVVVTVRTGGAGEPRDVRLVRARIQVPPVRDAQRLPSSPEVGYVRLTAFTPGSAARLGDAVRRLAGQGITSLVLDLRDNGGGSLLEAMEAAGLFLEGGRVARTRGRLLGATWTYDVPWLSRTAWKGPMAVLINGHTASAAELLAGALAARGRAETVGQRTFGKGAVQVNIPVEWGASAVCVTIARVYDPAGECLDGRGVAPARQVDEGPAPAPTIEADAVVRAAVEALRAPRDGPSAAPPAQGAPVSPAP